MTSNLCNVLAQVLKGDSDLMRVMSPGRVNDHSEMLATVEECQARLGAFSRDHGEELSEETRTAAVQMPLAEPMRRAVLGGSIVVARSLIAHMWLCPRQTSSTCTWRHTPRMP